MKEISERIKLIRKCSRKTKEEFAEKIGVSVELLSQWETDKQSPSVEELFKISYAFNVSTEYILHGIEKQADTAFLNKKLAKEDLLDDIKAYLLSVLKCKQSYACIDRIVDIAVLKEKQNVQNIDLTNKIVFEIQEVVDIADYAVYEDLQESFEIDGVITFALLSPNKHTLDFYNEALKNDYEQLEDTFLDYTSDRELWNDEIILWLINNGAVCLELVSYNIDAYSGLCNDSYPVDITVESEPIYEENLILTFLLKAELERRVNKQ